MYQLKKIKAIQKKSVPLQKLKNKDMSSAKTDKRLTNNMFSSRVKTVESMYEGDKQASERQKLLRELYHAEAMRYIDNAKKTLSEIAIEGGHYLDQKYVRTACGTAHNGILVALDGYSKLINYVAKDKNKKSTVRKSIEYYRTMLSVSNNRVLMDLNTAYNILHLCGYYDGETSIKIIKDGFEYAKRIIDVVKPTR